MRRRRRVVSGGASLDEPRRSWLARRPKIENINLSKGIRNFSLKISILLKLKNLILLLITLQFLLRVRILKEIFKIYILKKIPIKIVSKLYLLKKVF